MCLLEREVQIWHMACNWHIAISNASHNHKWGNHRLSSELSQPLHIKLRPHFQLSSNFTRETILGLIYHDIMTILKPDDPHALSWSNKDNNKGEHTWTIIVTVVENTLDQRYVIPTSLTELSLLEWCWVIKIGMKRKCDRLFLTNFYVYPSEKKNEKNDCVCLKEDSLIGWLEWIMG